LSRDRDSLQSPGLSMGTVAAELKSEREKRKIPLSQIAAETRISLRHLESLEEGRFSDLPGGIYNRAFLKAYCETLNLDPREIMRRYEAELPPVPERSVKSRVHIPQQTSSIKISPFVIWGLMLLISAAGLFFSRKWITAIFSPYFSHSPATSVRYEPAQPTPPTPAATTAPLTVPTPEAASEPVFEGRVLPPQDTATAAEPPAAAPAPPASAQTPAETAPPNSVSGIRLEISATEQCWVSVDRDGTPAIRKIMMPGEVQTFRPAEKFLIVLGNAGGVHLKLNGKPAKSLGKSGDVVKVLINEKSLQDMLARTAG
jgi:cytoskeleton protein RodZ